MRGPDDQTNDMFSYTSPEQRVRADHPLRAIRTMTDRVFAELSDGQFHSGEDLAHTLGVSRSAVWKAVKSLRDLGATLHAVRNRGYRLAKSSESLAAS